MNDLLDETWATGTIKAYTSASRQYWDFAGRLGILHHGRLAYPSEEDLVYFVTQRAVVRGNMPGTIHGLLHGIQAYFVANGFPKCLQSRDGVPLPLLQQAVRAIKRRYGKPKKQRLPVTATLLKEIVRWLRRMKRAGWRMFVALFTLAMYGLLRVGEVTSGTRSTHDAMRDACVSDVVVTNGGDGEPSSMTFKIKVSKVDCFRRGSVITLHATGTTDCPVAAMVDYLRHDDSGSDDALFRTRKGNATRNDVAKELKTALSGIGIDESNFNTHSFRSGGCCTLAAAGYGESVISIFGRWASSCWKQYLTLDQKIIREVCVAMSRVTTEDIKARGHAGIRGD